MKLLGTIVDFVLWLVKRILGKRDEPNNQLERAKDENSKIVATGDVDALDNKLDQLTGRLRGNGKN